MQLYAPSGQRLYLNAEERQRFLAVAAAAPLPIRSFALTLGYTGCRISEALALTPASIQTGSKVIAIRSLKKRDRLHMREVPVPRSLMKTLASDHQLACLKQAAGFEFVPLWQFSRTTGWRQIKSLMQRAGIAGKHATPKGLRHGFGINAIQAGVPLNLVQKWMGHANISVTAIYANAMGPEEYALARRMW